jgi:2-oxoglutarate dehydrogenase E1 component
VDVSMNVSNLAFEEAMYARYLRDRQSVSEGWRHHFDQISNNQGAPAGMATGPGFRPANVFGRNGAARRAQADASSSATDAGDGVADKQHCVDQLIRNYRVRGHMVARLDPLDRPRAELPELDPAYVGLTDSDLDRPFVTDGRGGDKVVTLRAILRQMHNTYCRQLGVQFMHIDDYAVRKWLQDRMESTENHIDLKPEVQLRILKRLTDAVVFEAFLQKKYIGAKTFSLEGAETLIPLLDLAITAAGEQGVDEIVLGMTHRGRLNVLANIVGKPAIDIFREFEDADQERYIGGGDVKYHLGYSGDWKMHDGRNVHVSLCFNPSHLEFINPVALGRVRAKQDRAGDRGRRRCMPLLIHGDAAFAGEGIVQESLNLSELLAYRVGGALHVVVNNQLGFTTQPEQYRSSAYCTDLARALQVPIFHVNGEEPEAVAQAVHLAMAFRHAYQRDVVIDMYCYRLHGHNEGDEPSFTQPLMYDTIKQHPPVRDAYLDHLLTLDGVSRDEAETLVDRAKRDLAAALEEARRIQYAPRTEGFGGIWTGYLGGPEQKVKDPRTALPRVRLEALLEALMTLPDDFHLHPKLKRGMKARREMLEGGRPLDWATAEALAFAALATEGHRVRLTGQDTERGTFSQRHAVLHDVEDGRTYVPLQHVADQQARVEIYNSPLSEAGVLGFEYGYSLDTPDGLVMWEAQFGDFVNAAQVIIDQFIASAEDKWNRLSGIVLLLPHGFEGQGPEHASARIERFLMLAAEDNMQLANPSTPAQYFHLLRRQVIRPWRKPLVVFTPKSLLRHAGAMSPLDDLAQGTFQRVIPDHDHADGRAIERVLLCTGKIYYTLLEHRETLGRDDVAIVRIEQLYPFPADELRSALARYPDGAHTVWVQEEPANMGAWPFLCGRSCRELFDRLSFSGVTRPESASPASGSHSAHQLEQERLIARAFGGV